MQIAASSNRSLRSLGRAKFRRLIKMLGSMRNIVSASLIFCTLTSYCFAHEDTIISLESNGAIIGLPEEYSPASLDIKFSAENGGSAERIRINIAGNELTVPRCVVSLIKTTKASDISLSASWYHQASSLPHYMNIEFYDPGYNPKKWANSGYSILLSLASAKVINIEYSQVNPDESSYQDLPVDLSSLYQEKELADFLDSAPTL